MSHNNKVLLIWQEIPENVSMYEFDYNSEEAKIAAAAHNIYVNADMETAPAERLCHLLAGRKPIYSSAGIYFKLDTEYDKPENEGDFPNTVSVEAPELMQPPVMAGNYVTIYVSGIFL